MPELPEVEIVRRGLEKRIVGLTIRDVEVRIQKLFKGDEDLLKGARIEKIGRRAKVLLIDLRNKKIASSQVSRNDISILIHLKMTGQLVFQDKNEKIKVVGGHPQKSYNEPLPHKHTHIIINFTNGSKLYFNDLRKFGWMMVEKTRRVENIPYIKLAGLEPLGEGGIKLKDKISKIKNKIQNSNRSIKAILLDQSIIAGLGNIYTDEILYESGIKPDRRGKDLTDADLERIFEIIPRILEKAIKCGGSSDSTFRNVEGDKGNYLDNANVYHKKADPKGHEIKKMKIAGRTAHFCPICQK